MNEHIRTALLIALQTIEDEDTRDIVLGDLDLNDDYVMAEVLPAILTELNTVDSTDDRYEYGFAWRKPSDHNSRFFFMLVGVDEHDLLNVIVESAIGHWSKAVVGILDDWDKYPNYKNILISDGAKKGRVNMDIINQLTMSSSKEDADKLAKVQENIIEIFNRHAPFEYLTLKEIMKHQKENPH